jgi:hypothetical protein
MMVRAGNTLHFNANALPYTTPEGMMLDVSMSPRRMFRIFACVLVVALLWIRSLRAAHHLFGWSMAVAATVAAAILLLVMPRWERKWRKMRDEVPKKPLGLDP